VEGKCPGKHNYSGRKCTRGKEMSRKTPQIQEKVHQQRGNVPEIATKPGESTTTERKCPGNRHKSRRKYTSKGEMSRKTPQIREKVHQQRGNVPEIPTKPGESTTAERKKRITLKGYPLYQRKCYNYLLKVFAI
jgi:hypothetical protein